MNMILGLLLEVTVCFDCSADLCFSNSVRTVLNLPTFIFGFVERETEKSL